ncbi:MAG: gamma-glutamyl-gamma-aminobutyrate hydrolase family protein [Rhodopseudomonas palustris]|nr:gamma-glutamyl-gamma-aminobutyrate hydrolase family protein [Rhodopseudomonas palustris]
MRVRRGRRKQVWRPGGRSGTVAGPCAEAGPSIGVISDRRTLGLHPFRGAGREVPHGHRGRRAGGHPVGPASPGARLRRRLQHLLPVLETLDGLLLTGSPSNVEPVRYQGSASRPGTLHDPERDHSAFELIPAVVREAFRCSPSAAGFRN